MKRIILFMVLMMSGCAMLENNPTTTTLAIQYSTLKYIDDDRAKAEQIVFQVDRAIDVVKNENITISALEDQVRNNIRWNRIDTADALIVNALINNIKEIISRSIDDGMINENDKMQIIEILTVIRDAARMVSR